MPLSPAVGETAFKSVELPRLHLSITLPEESLGTLDGTLDGWRTERSRKGQWKGSWKARGNGRIKQSPE